MNPYQVITAQLKRLANLPAYAEMNKTFKPVATERWCRGTLLPSESNNGSIGLNGFMIQQGLYQIDIFTPIGQGDEYELAKRIKEMFQQNNLLEVDDQELIIEKCWVDQSRSEASWLITSIVLRWFMPEARNV